MKLANIPQLTKDSNYAVNIPWDFAHTQEELDKVRLLLKEYND